MLEFEDIRFNCRLYNGYKPCRYGNECAGCTYFDPIEPAQDNGRHPAVSAEITATTHSDVEPTFILIIKTGAMGDVLRTTTVLHPLRRRYRDACIVWITDPVSVPLLAANPMIDRVEPFDPEGVKRVMAQAYDIVLNYEKEREPLALAGRVIAARRLGFAPTRWGTPTVFNAESRYALLLGVSDELKFRVNRKTYPEIICGMARLDYCRDPYVLMLTPEAIARRDEIAATCPAGRRPRVGLNTGCGSVFRTKQWPAHGWLELARHLRANTDADILLMGGPAERGLNRGIMAEEPALVDTGCDNTLEKFLGVVDACDVVVTSDSLCMHVAIALRKQVVAIFGSTSEAEVDLYDRGEKIVTDFPCAPCYRRLCNQDPEWKEDEVDDGSALPRTMCMEALRGEVVGAAVMRAIGRLAEERTASG